MKWSVKDEMNFLSVYGNYRSLWNIKVKNYTYVGTKRNKSAFTNFTESLKAEGLLNDMINRLKQKYTVWKNRCVSSPATELTNDTASTLASEWRVQLSLLARI